MQSKVPIKKTYHIERPRTEEEYPKRIIGPREAAIRAYIRWRRRQVKVDLLVERELKDSKWDSRDRGLFIEILYGVIRWRERIDWILSRLSYREGKIEEISGAAASIGIYQLLWLDRIPDHAVVDGSVEVARILGGMNSCGWVNAVLRRITREKDEWKSALPELVYGGEDFRLSIEHSYPMWMITRWRKRMGKEQLKKYLEWNNRRPMVMLRCNRTKCSPEEMRSDLESLGIGYEDFPLDRYYARIPHIGLLSNLEILNTGKVTVQDVSQGFVAGLLNPQNGEEILDLCAAPGGKTTHMAELAPEAKIFATDQSSERLMMVTRAIERGGYKNIELLTYDEVVGSKRQYDAVLVDAPCTGTGTLARRPDLRWRRKPDDVKRMAAVQLNLLRYAADRLKPGGRLVYSTCSIEYEENQGVITQFLGERRGFKVSSGSGDLPKIIFDADGYVNILGHEIGGDGAFAALLVKNQA